MPYPIPDVSTGGATGFRALTSASFALPLYPRSHLAPNGKVFVSGPLATSYYLDTSGTGAWSTVANSNYAYRSYGTSVMYDTGKVLILGGVSSETIPPTDSAEVIDLTAANPAWRNVAPMAFGRRHVNATLLPDGKVLITGGTSSPGPDDATGSVLAAEIWDPSTERFTTVASMKHPRLYHSSAVLLPDAEFCRRALRRPLGRRRHCVSGRRFLLTALPVQGRASDDIGRSDNS